MKGSSKPDNVEIRVVYGCMLVVTVGCCLADREELVSKLSCLVVGFNGRVKEITAW